MFGQKLKEQMKAKKFTIIALSKFTGVSTVSIAKYISGDRFPNVNNLMKICRVLDLDYDEIYDEYYRQKKEN